MAISIESVSSAKAFDPLKTTSLPIATRYDKLARNFLAGIQLAAATILLN
jgi:hypothetical protein